MKKRGLGKGLQELIGAQAIQATQQQDNETLSAVKTIAIDKLHPNPYQPRTDFDDEAIASLAESIKQYGIIQPLAVRVAKDQPDHYEIIAGERRFRAAKIAELETLPIVIHDISDEDSAVLALIENLQREDLNIIEQAKGIRQLIEQFQLTHDACGQVLGQSRSAISNTLRLLDLSDSVQIALGQKSIDMGHARALLGVSPDQQAELLSTVQNQQLSVRETEALVRKNLNHENSRRTPVKTTLMQNIEKTLSEHLKTPVQIAQNSKGKGKITLHFDDNEMLMHLSEQLGFTHKPKKNQ